MGIDNEVSKNEASYRIMSTRLHVGTAMSEEDCGALIQTENDVVYNQELNPLLIFLFSG